MRCFRFANPKMGEWIDQTLETDLAEKGHLMPLHLTGMVHGLCKLKGYYLRPTIAYCDSMNHVLSNREFLCPYASVVEVPQMKCYDRSALH